MNLIETFIALCYEFFYLLGEMAPYLLLGFFFASVIKVFVKQEWIYRFFGKDNLSSVLIASVIGIPVPVCSCGIIPIATTLRKEGASKGATLSFLISTPDSGVDSLLATYSLMGLLFTIVRTVSTTILAIFVGLLTNLFTKREVRTDKAKNENSCPVCDLENPHKHSFIEKVWSIVKYGFFTLIDDIGKWLVVGIIVGAIIIFFIPDNFVDTYLQSNVLSYLSVLALSIPLYICATGSIPIALALILKGFSPGTALVFLIVGPATNTATLTVIWKLLGKRTLLIFLIALTLGSVLLGYIVDISLDSFKINLNFSYHTLDENPINLKTISSVILIGLIIYSSVIYPLFIKRKKKTGCCD